MNIFLVRAVDMVAVLLNIQNIQCADRFFLLKQYQLHQI